MTKQDKSHAAILQEVTVLRQNRKTLEIENGEQAASIAAMDVQLEELNDEVTELISQREALETALDEREGGLAEAVIGHRKTVRKLKGSLEKAKEQCYQTLERAQRAEKLCRKARTELDGHRVTLERAWEVIDGFRSDNRQRDSIPGEQP